MPRKQVITHEEVLGWLVHHQVTAEGYPKFGLEMVRKVLDAYAQELLTLLATGRRVELVDIGTLKAHAMKTKEVSYSGKRMYKMRVVFKLADKKKRTLKSEFMKLYEIREGQFVTR